MDLSDPDQGDTAVDDPDRQEEVQLTARLIVAANESVSPLSAEHIDTILGVYPQQ